MIKPLLWAKRLWDFHSRRLRTICGPRCWLVTHRPDQLYRIEPLLGRGLARFFLYAPALFYPALNILKEKILVDPLVHEPVKEAHPHRDSEEIPKHNQAQRDIENPAKNRNQGYRTGSNQVT